MSKSILAKSRPGSSITLGLCPLVLLAVFCSSAFADGDRSDGDRFFRRVATFPVFLNTDIDAETLAEIVAASEDGELLIYTDAAQELIGFVDIKDPSSPQPAGTISVRGEPTSVGVAGRYVLVSVVDPDSTFSEPRGHLEVFQISTRRKAAEIDLGGQPDAVAVSPDRRYAAIAIENERDEDLGDGRPPQSPPGKMVIVDLIGGPRAWRTRDVDLVGIPSKFPSDPEPEFVDINELNIAALTMQENNHIALVYLPTGQILNDFSAGTVNLDQIDATENDLIELVESLTDIPREPDAIAWANGLRLVTADEGDLEGGSRGFTIFDPLGNVRFSSGNSYEHLVVRIGHYPESRSENKGNEPEGAEFGRYGSDSFLFIGSERSSVVAVYKLDFFGRPEFHQVLPGALGPEGLLAIPQRDLFISTGEEDSRDDKYRGSITIYQYVKAPPSYPTIVSQNRADGTPIPWAALSALAGDLQDRRRAWTVYDSYYRKSRIFELDAGESPAVITGDTVLRDGTGIFASVLADTVDPDALPDFDPDALLNEDGSINVDPEGLAVREDGGFWLASEGAGTVGDEEARPIVSRNWLFKVGEDGQIIDVVDLPDDTNARQRRFGLEGVASVGSGENEVVYVCFQREWAVEAPEKGRDPAGLVRIGRYETASRDWTFFYYPLDAPESPNGGWVGLSEIVDLDETTFAVVERDNQGGPDARIKRIYAFSIAGLTPLPEAPVGEEPDFPIVSKTLVRDLMPDLLGDNGPVIEKVEGLTVLADGAALIVTDNDGVDDSSGETQFINLGKIFGGDHDRPRLRDSDH